jgi:hypothetical protein
MLLLKITVTLTILLILGIVSITRGSILQEQINTPEYRLGLIIQMIGTIITTISSLGLLIDKGTTTRIQSIRRDKG